MGLERLEWVSFLTRLGEAKLGNVLQLLIFIVRREPLSLSSLDDFGGIGKTIAGTLAGLVASDGVEELFSSNSTR